MTIDGITFTLSAPGPLTGRDRGATNAVPGQILRDFIYDGNFQRLTLSVTGMAAGTYDVESWHYDSDFGERTDLSFNMIILQNSIESVVARGYWTTNSLRYQVTTDGSDFDLVYKDTWVGSSDTRMNGITFAFVPPDLKGTVILIH